jgi:hypothetical protein
MSPLTSTDAAYIVVHTAAVESVHSTVSGAGVVKLYETVVESLLAELILAS